MMKSLIAAASLILIAAADVAPQEAPANRRGTLEVTVRLAGEGSSEVGTGTVARTMKATVELVGLPSASNPLDPDADPGEAQTIDILAQALAACAGNRECENTMRQQLAGAPASVRGTSGVGVAHYMHWGAMEDFCGRAELTIRDEARARYADEGGGPQHEYVHLTEGTGTIEGRQGADCVEAVLVHDTRNGRYWLRIGMQVSVDVTETNTRNGAVLGGGPYRRAFRPLDGDGSGVDWIVVPDVSGASGTATVDDVFTRTFDAQWIRHMPVSATVTWKFVEARQ